MRERDYISKANKTCRELVWCNHANGIYTDKQVHPYLIYLGNGDAWLKCIHRRLALRFNLNAANLLVDINRRGRTRYHFTSEDAAFRSDAVIIMFTDAFMSKCRPLHWRRGLVIPSYGLEADSLFLSGMLVDNIGCFHPAEATLFTMSRYWVHMPGRESIRNIK
jgi:hypothetical protein